MLGVNVESVRCRLLRQKDLTRASAIEICRAAEMTDIRIQAIAQDRPVETVQSTDGCRLDRIQNQTTNTWDSGMCRFCGNTHEGVIYVQLLEKTVGAVGPQITLPRCI